MPRTPRCMCAMCEKNFDQLEMRTIGSGLLRVFLAVRLSKRISSEECICQRCWLQFFHWHREMDGDFDGFGPHDKSENDYLANDNIDIVIYP